MYCLSNLPRTDYIKCRENATEKLLWGRMDFVHAASFLYFSKGGITQRVLYQIKYRNRPGLAVELGKMMGRVLMSDPQWSDLDGVVPVPLHEKKMRKRGYNQSEELAKGMVEVMGLPVVKNLIRVSNHHSQTRSSRERRWANVRSDFKLRNREELSNKNLLLVDDVITTGATLDACAAAIHSAKGVKLYILTLAIPMN